MLAAPAFAYDAIPEVSADFEALEKARVLEAASDKLKSKELNVKVAKIEAATTPQEFPPVRLSAYSAGSTVRTGSVVIYPNLRPRCKFLPRRRDETHAAAAHGDGESLVQTSTRAAHA